MQSEASIVPGYQAGIVSGLGNGMIHLSSFLEATRRSAIVERPPPAQLPTWLRLAGTFANLYQPLSSKAPGIYFSRMRAKCFGFPSLTRLNCVLILQS